MLEVHKEIQRQGLCPIFGGIRGTENILKNQDINQQNEKNHKKKWSKGKKLLRIHTDVEKGVEFLPVGRGVKPTHWVLKISIQESS